MITLPITPKWVAVIRKVPRMGCLRQMGWAVIEGHRETSGLPSSTIHREARSQEISVIRLRENLEVLAVDEIIIVYQEIAGVFHFAPDFFFLNSVTE